MEFNGPFLTQTIADAGKLSTDDYATAPVPGKSGAVNQTLGVADAIQVFKTDDKDKLAALKKFMTFAMNDDNQLAFAKEYALLPGMTSAADSLHDDPVLGHVRQDAAEHGAVPVRRELDGDRAAGRQEEHRHRGDRRSVRGARQPPGRRRAGVLT